MDSRTVGNYLKEKRRERNLTQSELGDMLYVSDKAVSRWETGNTLPDPAILPQLADILGVTTDEILSAGVRGEAASMDRQKLQSNKIIMLALLLAVAVLGYTRWGIYLEGGGDSDCFWWEADECQPYLLVCLLCYAVLLILHKKGDRLLYWLELLLLSGLPVSYCYVYYIFGKMSYFHIFSNAFGAVLFSLCALIFHWLLFHKQSYMNPETDLWTGRRKRHILALITVVCALFIFWPTENGFQCNFIFAFLRADSKTMGNVPKDPYKGVVLTLGWLSLIANFLLAEAFDNWKKGFHIPLFITDLHIIVSAFSSIFRFNYHGPRIWIVIILCIMQIIITTVFMKMPDHVIKQ